MRDGCRGHRPRDGRDPSARAAVAHDAIPPRRPRRAVGRGVGHGYGVDEPSRVGVLGTSEHPIGVADLDQLAGPQHADPVRHLVDHGQVVADEQAAEAQLLLQGPEQLEHVGLHRHVERAGRLVGDHQAGLAAPGRGPARPAAAGRRRARAAAGRRTTTRGGPRRAARPPGPAARPAIPTRCTSRGSRTVSATLRRGSREDAGSWWTKARSRRSSRSSRPDAEARSWPADQHPAGGDRDQPGRDTTERRLARPRLPHQADDLAGRDGQRRLGDGGERLGAQPAGVGHRRPRRRPGSARPARRAARAGRRRRDRAGAARLRAAACCRRAAGRRRGPRCRPPRRRRRTSARPRGRPARPPRPCCG